MFEREEIMTGTEMYQIFKETAYVRMGGSKEELACAQYIKDKCAEFGGKAEIESFEVDMATIQEAKLIVDGQEIPCKGYLLAGSGEIEAPLYYLTTEDEYALRQCAGKIVMVDGYLRYWMYHDMLTMVRLV